MIFLSSDELEIINNLNRIRNTTVLNGNGNKTSKTAFLNGINVCKLDGAKLSMSRNGRYYMEVIFSRQPQVVFGEKRYFAPLSDYIFYPDGKLESLCKALGHDLKPKPDDYSISGYLNAVCKRVNTFIGKEIKVVVRAYNDTVKDDYGTVEQASWINGVKYNKEVTRVDVIGYYSLNDEIIIDWSTML